ncbi:BZ3500_MvSof-1268-A1-R1_Chr3-3g06510 [Microbotryum saponariae]|uniref:BZ3500_MvSof-1268-A1-R1_Chr3-3g06510 protein n=1 Tax=Microbotryum saponariae TaxID=289078 RepID=A0A2X0NH60_9BASI|nr:BZ3500_MvSof-1268-A1-R1_Chr3-3g06510 [Microbotryum saponariae]SDA04477.1 BZ3501_MvSof-1269-A2-R1_Chr3-2g06197 [Microbotryum saponariae]
MSDLILIKVLIEWINKCFGANSIMLAVRVSDAANRTLGFKTMRVPRVKAQAVVGHQVTGGAAIIAGTAVGGPAGAAIGLGVAGVIQGIKHLNKNHDGVIKYETMWVTPGDLATDQAGRANWFKCTSSSRLPGARALYEMSHRIVRC